MDLNDVDSPADFLDPDLKSWDEMLRCPICCDIMNTATLLPKCSHNFCSLCIRRHIEVKKQCPLCTEVCSESSLLNNRLINQLAILYNQKLRPKLLATLENGENMDVTDVGDLSKILEEPKTPKASYTLKKSQNTPCLGQPAVVTMNSMFQTVKSAKQPIKTVGEVSCYQSVASGSVELNECPVCSGMIPSQRLNSHLDQCLQRKEREASFKSPHGAKKRLPKLVWSMITEKNLKKHCKEYSLSTSGRRAELTKRLKEFTLRYNAQCEADVMKSKAELALEVERTELMYKSPVSLVNKLKTGNDRAEYSKKHEGQFIQLINAARKTTQKTSQKATTEDDELQIISATTPIQHTSSILSFLSSTHTNCKHNTDHIKPVLQSTPTKDSTLTSHIVSSPKSKVLSFTETERELHVLSQACIDDLDDFEFDDFEDFSSQSNSNDKSKQLESSGKSKLTNTVTVTPSKSSNRSNTSQTHSTAKKDASFSSPTVDLTSSITDDLFSPSSTIAPTDLKQKISQKNKINKKKKRSLFDEMPMEELEKDWTCIDHEVSRLYEAIPQSQTLSKSPTSKLDKLLLRSYNNPQRSKISISKHDDSLIDELLNLENISPDSSSRESLLSLPCTQNVRELSPVLSLDLSQSSLPSYSPNTSDSHIKIFDSPPGEIPSLYEEDLTDIESQPASPTIGILTNHQSPGHQSPGQSSSKRSSGESSAKRSSGESFRSSRKRGRTL